MQEQNFANLISVIIMIVPVIIVAINCWWIGKKGQTSNDPMDWHQMCR